MRTFLLITIAAVSALFHSVDATGSLNRTYHVRRRDTAEIRCITLLKHILYEEGTAPEGATSKWACQLLLPDSGKDGNGNIFSLKGLAGLAKPNTVEKFKSGVTRITVPGGVIQDYSIIIPPGTHIFVDEDGGGPTENSAHGNNIFENHLRRLVQGDKRVIVIRVVDSTGVKTSASASQLSDNIFGTSGDPHNLVSQYKKCSYNKFRLAPTTKLSNGDPGLNAVGVYEVRLPISVRNVENVIVREAITDQLNIDWPGTRLPEDSGGRLDTSVPFDYALYCLPPGTKGSWIAYAFANSWLSVYNNDWCNYISVTMHEVGHNLNLGHSGDGNAPGFPESVYGDKSGMMGFSYALDDSPVQCFNSAKSWQLGWYADKAVATSPIVSSGGFSGRIMGISDYQQPTGYNVLVKIETGQDVDYYLNFNRKTGMNSGTLEGGDSVMLTRQGGNGIGYSDSQVMASLSSGQQHTLSNFGGSGKSVRVQVKEIRLSSTPAYAEVVISSWCTTDAQCQQQGSPSTCSPQNWFCNRATNYCDVSSQGNSRCNCDYRCDASLENESTCPSDCARRLDFVTTLAADKGQAGNQYDIKATNDIQIIGFEIHVQDAGRGVTAEVYTKTGSYVGFERNADAWTRIQRVAVISKGEGSLTPLSLLPQPLSISAGATQAFYVTLTSGDMRYTTGNNLGALYRANSNLRFFQGVGKTYPFGSTYSPRIWNGRIKYVEASPSPPTPQPNPPPPSPSPLRWLDTTMEANNGQSGNQFSLKAKSTIAIAGFEIHAINSGTTLRAEVWTKSGSHEGFEQNETEWKRIQIANVVSQGTGKLTPLPLLWSPISIRAGATQAFYVTLTTNAMRYTNGQTVGSLFSWNGDLEFFEGSGNVYPFAAVFAPRVFNGRIKYRRPPSTEEPPRNVTVMPSVLDFSTMPSFEPSLEPTTKSPELSNEPTMVATERLPFEPSIVPSSDNDVKSIEPSGGTSLEPSQGQSFNPSMVPSRDVQESTKPSYTTSATPTPVSTSDKLSIVPSSSEAEHSNKPSREPSMQPTEIITSLEPSMERSAVPTMSKLKQPSVEPTLLPTTSSKSDEPSLFPSSNEPSREPSMQPTEMSTSLEPSTEPSADPTMSKSNEPSIEPSVRPTTAIPSDEPSSNEPSMQPTEISASLDPSTEPSLVPTMTKSNEPSIEPTALATSAIPSDEPSMLPSSNEPFMQPTEQSASLKPSTEQPSVDDPTIVKSVVESSMEPTSMSPTSVLATASSKSVVEPSILPSKHDAPSMDGFSTGTTSKPSMVLPSTQVTTAEQEAPNEQLFPS